MSAPLSKGEKNRAKVILALLTVSLLLQRTDEENGGEPDENPAVKQCVMLIDELFKNMPGDRRSVVTDRIQKRRVQFTKKVQNYGVAEGLVGSLRVLTDENGIFKTKPGTRLDFIVGTFRQNLRNIEEALPIQEKQADEFAKKFKTMLINF